MWWWFIVLYVLLQPPKRPKKGASKKWSKLIGLEAVKEELDIYFDFLRNPNKYENVRLPRGVLLSGPPGCGKTLLVRIMAEQCSIPLHATSGSEFMEKYVGVGAARMRALFAKAKEPSLIFIDEIDAIATKRDRDNSERARTLNQLLVEMDGFQSKTGVMVFAATNMPGQLDPALLRSGRFDKKIHFDLPNRHERLELYRLYLEGETLPEGVSIDLLAERSTGLSGADVETICNQAKLNTIQRDATDLNAADLTRALDEIMIGREQRSRTMSNPERRRVAYHEAGHACLSFWLRNTVSPLKVSIVPRGAAALGFSQSKPPTSVYLQSEKEIRARMAVLFGGRGAERLVLGTVSTGAADDLEQIRLLSQRYFLSYGMGREPLYPELPVDEQQTLLSDLETFVEQTLRRNQKALTSVAETLLEDETISYETLRSLLTGENATEYDHPSVDPPLHPPHVLRNRARPPCPPQLDARPVVDGRCSLLRRARHDEKPRGVVQVLPESL